MFFYKLLNKNLYFFKKIFLISLFLSLIFYLIINLKNKFFILSNEIKIGVKKNSLNNFEINFLKEISNKMEKVLIIKEFNDYYENEGIKEDIDCYFNCFEEDLKKNKKFIKLNLNYNLTFFISEKSSFFFNLIEDSYYLNFI